MSEKANPTMTPDAAEAAGLPPLELRLRYVLSEFVARPASEGTVAELKAAVAQAIDEWVDSGRLELWHSPQS